MKKIIFTSCILLAVWSLIALAQQSGIKFSHKFHIEDVEASCTDCHTAALSSTSPADNLLPNHDNCYTCHDEDETECGYCHVDGDNPQALPRVTGFKAQFPHQKHAAGDDDCMKCHPGITDKEESGIAQNLPGRDVCTNCHGQFDFYEEKVQCVTCHSKDFDFKPETHSLLWKKNHGPAWQTNQNSCNHCHQNNYCTDCHQGDNLDRLAHPFNFVNNHGMQAKGNKDNCLTCHEEQAFCIDCHRTELVMPQNHNYAGWVNTSNGGRHAREALYDFDTCSSCHNDAYTDNTCLRCHQK